MLGFVWSLIVLAILGTIGYGIYYYVATHGYSGEMLVTILIGWFVTLLIGTAIASQEYDYNGNRKDENDTKGENIFGTVMLVILVSAILSYCVANGVDLHLPFTIKRN